MTSRRRLLFYSVPLLGTAYACGVEPQCLRTRKVEVTIPGLPVELEGFKIGQLTDFHYHHYERGFIERAIKKLMAHQPDLIALTGDFNDKSANNLPALIKVLAPLKARCGVYAVMGNHDYTHYRSPAFKKEFASSEIRVLVNDTVETPELQIIGLDSISSSQPDFHLPVPPQSGKLRLLLAHEPDLFDQAVAAYRPDLQLSGHTHGGQGRIPFLGYAPFVPPYGRKYRDGLFSIDQSQLFVSSGLGTSILRMRVACLPEVVILTLKKGK